MTQLPSGRDMFVAKPYAPQSLEADVLASLRAPVDARELANIEADEDDEASEEEAEQDKSDAVDTLAAPRTSSYF